MNYLEYMQANSLSAVNNFILKLIIFYVLPKWALKLTILVKFVINFDHRYYLRKGKKL